MRHRSLRPRLWCAPALLFLFQTAPVRPYLDEVGHLRVAFGVSAGGYNDRDFDCGGSVIRTSPVRYRVASGQLEGWAGPKIRIAAVAGAMGGSSDSTGTDLRTGGFGSVLTAWEGTNVGIGIGLGVWPKEPFGRSTIVPTAFFRAGKAEKLHFRIDDQSSAAPGWAPGVRLGIASGFGPPWQTRWFVGLLVHPFGPSEDASTSFGAELSLPIRARVQPVLQGAVGPNTQWNLGVGLRAALGKAR